MFRPFATSATTRLTPFEMVFSIDLRAPEDVLDVFRVTWPNIDVLS